MLCLKKFLILVTVLLGLYLTLFLDVVRSQPQIPVFRHFAPFGNGTKKPNLLFGGKLPSPFNRNGNLTSRILTAQQIRAERIRRISQKFLFALNELNHNPNMTLEQMFPKLLPLKKLGNVTEIRWCYNDLVGRKRVNVFRTPLRQIVQTFFEENSQPHFKLLRMVDILKRVESFVRNLREFAQLISQCMRSPRKEKTRFGLTPLSAMTPEEHRNFFNNKLNLEAKMLQNRFRTSFGRNRTKRSNEEGLCTFDLKEPLRKRFDWRSYGAVTRVKNQGSCSSCFIFATMAAFESAILRRQRARGEPIHPKKLSLSEQSVLNCFRCGDGFMHEAYEHLMKYGAPSGSRLPYKGRASRCTHKDDPEYKLNNYCQFNRPLTDREIQILIQKYGPVAAAIDGSARSFVWLRGKFNGRGCKSNNLNHSLVIVGWNEKYWILKNSWSSKWGIKGYLYLKRDNGLCGINQMISVPFFNGKRLINDDYHW